MLALESTTDVQREHLLAMILHQLGSDTQSAFEHLGITHEEFIQLYHRTGETRSIRNGDHLVGFVWIEHRGRELHIHGIIVLEEWRGRGIGAEVLRLLEIEFCGDADTIELGVQTSNSGARRFYQRMGFRAIDREIPKGFVVLHKLITLNGTAPPTTTVP